MCVSTDAITASEPSPTGRTILFADVAVDAMGTSHSPAAIVVDNDCIEAIGHPASVGALPNARRVDCSGHVVLPGLVNAHSHLDLSGSGPMRPDANFRRWLAGVRESRLQSTAADRTQATTHGIALLRAGGTVAVGDIVGGPADETLEVLMGSTMRGVAFMEVFGLGSEQRTTIDRLKRLQCNSMPGPMRLGCSPHAPYTCSVDVYRAAAETGLPIATHLAETAAEASLLEEGTGDLRDLLVDDIGIPASALPALPAHAVTSLSPYLHGALCVHLNCIDRTHAETLASIGAVACLCPRATAYFGRDVPGPLSLLREAGVSIALGTDSLLCLDTPHRISVLDEMRLLHRVGDVSPLDLLAMGTTLGAQALGVDPQLVDLRPGPTAGIIALPLPKPRCTAAIALGQVLESNDAPRWVIGPC